RVRRHRSGRGQRAATLWAVRLGRHTMLATSRADLLSIHLTPSRLATELVSTSIGAGPFSTRTCHVISVRWSVYYIAACFIPGLSVVPSRCALFLVFRSAPTEIP